MSGRNAAGWFSEIREPSVHLWSKMKNVRNGGIKTYFYFFITLLKRSRYFRSTSTPAYFAASSTALEGGETGCHHNSTILWKTQQFYSRKIKKYKKKFTLLCLCRIEIKTLSRGAKYLICKLFVRIPTRKKCVCFKNYGQVKF